MRFKVGLILFFALSGRALGQSVLSFPRVISTTQIFTSVAVSNPTAAEASVTFAAFEADGTPLTQPGVPNPRTITVPAGGEYERQFQEIFPIDGSFNGWIQATSATRGLTGFFLNSNSRLTDLDGAAAGTPIAEFILPMASEDPQTTTELTLVNVNSETARITITLYAFDGTVIALKNVTLRGRALMRQTLAMIFRDASLANASHLRVHADRPVIGHEVVADFQIPQVPLRRETIAISGQTPAETEVYVLPQFVTGNGWASYISVVNGSGIGQEVTLTAYKDDGTRWDVPANPKRISLAGNGSLKTTAEQLFEFPSSTLSAGWIEMRSSAGFIIGNAGFGQMETPSFTVFSGVDTTHASGLGVYSPIAEGGGFYTGLTLVNAGHETAEAEVSALRVDGTTVGKFTLTLGPNQRVAKLFREFLPATFEQLGGWAFMRSSQPVIGAVVFGSSNGLALGNLPGQTLGEEFVTPAQRTAAITGTVIENGFGASGVTVTLTGPVTAARITDASGIFAFTQLPPGQYRVSVKKGGIQFFPSQRILTVALENVDDLDFEGATGPAGAPVLSLLTPSSLFNGTSAVAITVFGSNFSDTSVVELDNQQLVTTFINSTELRAVVPAMLLRIPGTFKATVFTPSADGGISNSADLTINVMPNNPLIGGRSSVGPFPAGVAIHPTRKLALITSESGDSVRIIDLKSLETIADVKVGRSPAEGVAVYPDQDLALVGNVGDDNVSVVDLRTNREVEKIAVQKFPTGIAVNSVTQRAVVVNGESDSVSVIDLTSMHVISTIPVGKGPASVAINPRKNSAVVTNRRSNDITIIDLSSNTVAGTLRVGLYPRGVAINPNTNIALVVNANSNNLSIIDLGAPAVIGAVDVGSGPTAVAIHLPSNMAVVTNSGTTRGSTVYGAINTVSIVSIDQQRVVETVPVGSGPFGIDVDAEMQKAVVANFASNDITVVRLLNPKPVVSDVQPKTFPAGGGTFTITVRGAGFIPLSVVTLNGQPLVTTYVSSLELRAEITTAIMDQLSSRLPVEAAAPKDSAAAQQATPLSFDIGVSNPGPGGGESDPPKDPTSTRIQRQNPAPILIGMDPMQVSATAADLRLKLSGSNFSASSRINFGTIAYSPSTVSDTSMTVVIPGADLRPGPVPVSVTNPPPGGGTTPALTFTVVDRENPPPAITSVSPTEVPAGSGPTAIRMSGSGFIPATAVSIEGAAVQTTASNGLIELTVNAALLQNAGSLHVLVTNPAPGGGSANFNINVLNPAPSIASFSPDTASSGSSSLDVRVLGSRFRPNSAVTVEGTPIPTRMVSSEELRGTVPGAFLSKSGRLRVGATNPSPGGGSADAGILTITDSKGTLKLDSIVPATLRADQAGTTIELNGSNFVRGVTVVVGEAELPAQFVSSSLLRITLPAPMPLGKLPVAVKNSSTSGISNAMDLTITSLVPVIAEIRPPSIAIGQTITVLGMNFGRGSRVVIGEMSVGATPVSDTQLAAVVPLEVPLGTTSVRVVNPEPGGGSSNAVSISISAAKIAQAVDSVEVVLDGSSKMTSLGETRQLKVNVKDNQSNLIPGKTIMWSSGRSDVVEIDSTGKATARRNGTARLIATVEGKSGGLDVFVDQAVASVDLQPASKTFVSFGETQIFKATAKDARSNLVDGKTAVWSAIPAIVSVDTTGLVIAGAADGDATVTVTIDGSVASAPVKVAQETAIVRVTPDMKVLTALPAVQDFSAVAQDARGNPVNKPVEWSSSNPAVASIDASGRVTAVDNGRVIISAKMGNKTGLAALIIAHGTARIGLSKGSSQFAALKRMDKIIATFFDANGSAVPKAFLWTSDNESVATVDQSGTITAAGNGTATITVSAEGVSASATVVVSQMLNRVTITEIGSGKLKAFGNKRRFTAQAVDLDGYPILGKVASWKSSNEAVASIDATGEATAKQNGTVTLIASVEDQFAGATLVVDQELASVLSLTGEGKLTALNRGRQYKAVDANGNSIVGKNLAWASSSDAVASVDQAGLAKARGNGIAKISATVDGKSLSADLEVSQEVASLQVTSDSTGKLTALKRQRKFTANAKDPDGYDITSKVVVWSSSDPTIASIDGTGVATAQRNGKINIRAAIDGFQSPPVDLEIQQVLAAILSIDGSGKLKSKGETRQFAAADAGGSALSNPITWRIMGDPAVATIDANGKLTATKNRKTTVTATDGSVSVSTDVEVEQMAARIVITKGKTTLPGVRKQTTFEAIAYDANSYVVEDKVIAWSVSNPAVATITTSGDVISVSTGVTKIRASMDSVTTEVDLTVN